MDSSSDCRPRRTWAWLVSAVLAGAPVTATAAPAKTTVGLQPTRGAQGLPEGWVESLEGRLTEGLGRGAFEVKPTDDSSAATCDAPDCRARLLVDLGAPYLAQLSVNKIDSDYELTIELFGANGQQLVIVEGQCDTCGIAEVQSKVADQAALVRSKLDALRRGRPKIRFESEPAGARLYLDGTLIGTTPLVTEADDGRHRVTVEQKGYVSLEREITAVSGTEETVKLDLQLVPRSKRFMPWGIGSMVFGVATAAAGATLLVFHERPFEDTCTGSNVDDDGDCRLVYDTFAGGIALTAVGGAAIITGAVLLGLSSDRKGKGKGKRARVDGLTVRF